MTKTGNLDRREHPRDGDVLLAQEADAAARFTVSVVPGPGQIAFASYRKALATARIFAQHSRATLWIQRAGSAPRPVGERRQPREAVWLTGS